MALVFLFVILTGCGKNGVDPGLQLRDQLLKCNGYSFLADITADYGENIYSFTVCCTGDANGDLSFTVIKPDSIAEIAGSISLDGGKLNFDDHILAFPLLADGQISPVSTPWLLIYCLRSGYITHGGIDGNNYMIHIDDSYAQNNIGLDVWLDSNNIPIQADFIWAGRRFLTMIVKDFEIL